MSYRKTVLAQILGGLEVVEFARCAAHYPMKRATSAISAFDHFATMVFAQLTYRESLRDIEACFGARRQLLYHSGIRGTVKRCESGVRKRAARLARVRRSGGRADAAGAAAVRWRVSGAGFSSSRCSRWMRP